MILVFGGDGQLGRELADAAAHRALELQALSRHDADIADAAATHRIIERISPSLVVNAAAYTDVERAEAETDEAYRTNSEGARVLATACGHSAIPLVHVSTDFVFDGRKQAPYSETDEVRPLNAYGRSKAAGEAHVMAATDHYAIVRTSWMFSKYGRNFVKTMLTLARDRDEIRVVGDQFGCPTSARSLAAAILDIAPRLSADKSVSGLYHFAGAPATTWYALASHVIAAQARSTSRTPRVTAISTADFGARAQRPAHSALDCTKIKRVFDIEPADWMSEADAVVDDILLANW